MQQALEIRRETDEYPLARAKQVFDEFGVVVLKHFLPVDSQPALRNIIANRLEKSRTRGGVLQPEKHPAAEFLLGDLLAVRELEAFDHIFFRSECIRVVKALLETDELTYWGDSSIQTGEAARGFHKDNVDRSDGTRDDWKGNYGLVRCGFYFQDHTYYSGGLKVRLASHKIANHLQGRMSDIRSEYGDLLIWSMRLTHSGNNRRLKLHSRLVLHPRLEERLPKFLRLEEGMRRIAAFCSFGRQGSHLNRYISRMNERETDYRPYFQYSRKPAEAAALVANYGLTFRQPSPVYGELD